MKVSVLNPALMRELWNQIVDSGVRTWARARVFDPATCWQQIIIRNKLDPHAPEAFSRIFYCKMR